MTKSQEGSSIEPYRTSDTPYAAYLDYHQQTLVGIRPALDDPKRKVFVFVYTEEIPKLEQEWRFGKPLGNLKKYHRSLKIVTRKVQEALREEEQNNGK